MILAAIKLLGWAQTLLGDRPERTLVLSNRIWTGVWLSSIPVDSEHGFEGDALLMVKLDIDDHELARWEWAGEGRTYREWLIPANLINQCATFELVDQMDFSTVVA